MCAAVFLVWRFDSPIRSLTQTLPASIQTTIQDFATTTTFERLQSIENKIFTPPPFKNVATNSGARSKQQSTLSVAGVISWTNNQRRLNGSPAALKQNALLNNAAKVKLNDLFAKQYFEHISPSGVGPSDLARQAGYAYISIGENLALGDFESDQALVQDWMNSPGHRANILNKDFTEIGVAVGQGQYQGKQVWIAVQEFGRPVSSCPVVDQNLKAQIAELQGEVDSLQPQLAPLKAQIDSAKTQTQADYDAYNKLVDQYNNLVKVYNNEVDSLKLSTNQYNAQVAAYNSCAGN